MARAEKEVEKKALKSKKRHMDEQLQERQQQGSGQHSIRISMPILGSCFACGEVGHIQKICPKLVSAGNTA